MVNRVIVAAPAARTDSNAPRRSSDADPRGWMMCVEGVSEGKCALSTTQTLKPRLASWTASGDPAQRAPTITTSKTCMTQFAP